MVEQGAKIIFEALKNNSTLRAMILSYHFKKFIMRMLKNVLNQQKKKGNEKIGDEICSMTPSIFNSNSTLKELDLRF